MKKGIMLVISGPAGCGKGTVCKHLLATGDYKLSVSATTRAPRPGETDGVNYYYITRKDFISRIKSGDMLEHTEYCGNMYGTPKKEAESVLETGKNLILEIEVEGARNIKAKFPEAVLIFLLPPSAAVQEQRLRSRATETEDKILERLARAKEEIKYVGCYDYVVYNNDGLDKQAAEEILKIIEVEQSAVRRNPDVAKIFLGQ